jgi:hypothetical protein
MSRSAAWLVISLVALAAVGCSADTTRSRAAMPGGSVEVLRPDDAGPPLRGDAAVPASVTITTPRDGASFVRSSIEAGEWVAPVTFHVASAGAARVELVAAGTSMGETDATGALSYSFHADGPITVDAIGRDAAGTELARSSVTITIAPPVDTGCHAMLDALGLDWELGPATHGVADPVYVQPLIHGVTYRYETSTTAERMLMDCRLGPRLAMLSDLLATYGVVELEHIGIYNYRCIGGGNPDTDGCTPSMHAQALAIDLHAFITGDGTRYDVETDFVITRTHDSCPIASSSEADRILKEIACRLVAERIFQIVLTPNYNADHRNHFHCDLTEGSMYLGATAAGVDPVIESLGD